MKILKVQQTITNQNTIRYWFDIMGRKEEYSIWIESSDGEIIDSSCDCVFMSFYANGPRFKDQKCRHIKHAIEYLKNDKGGKIK